MYKFKYCKELCSSKTDRCEYGTFCKDTKITTGNNTGTVTISSKTINFDASTSIALNNIQITDNEIYSENDIIISSNNLDMSINNLNINANDIVDISSLEVNVKTDKFIIEGGSMDISTNDFDIKTDSLDISVNSVNVKIGGNEFLFQKDGSLSDRMRITDFSNNKEYYIDGSNGQSCSIM
jgi:hypothetical protein